MEKGTTTFTFDDRTAAAVFQADYDSKVDASMMGIGIQHDLTQYLGLVGKLPFSIAVLGAYTKADIEFVNAYLNKQQTIFFTTANVSILVGSSGSFETIFEMVNKMDFPATGDSFELPLELVIKELNWLISSTLEERMNNQWIVSIRKKMMPIAALKMKWIIEKMNIKQVFVSPYSLKEGVFMSNLDEI